MLLQFLGVTRLEWVPWGQCPGDGRAKFLLPEGELPSSRREFVPCLFQLHKAAAFFGLWILPAMASFQPLLLLSHLLLLLMKQTSASTSFLQGPL